MACLKDKTSAVTILPGKRPFYDDDGGLEEFARPRPLVTKYPPPKIRYGVQVKRDFPPGCGRTGNSVGFSIQSNQLKELGEAKATNPSSLKRPAGKVKFFDPMSLKEESDHGVGDAPKGSCTTSSKKELTRHEKIKEAMAMFHEVHKKVFKENQSKPKGEKIAHWRVPVEAVKIVKQKMKWLDDSGKKIGSISGVQIGDEFQYRSQLQMIGLHCQPQCGIDYINNNGYILAVSIVDSHRYSNDHRVSSDELFYSGQGGVKFLGVKQIPEDQKLERGNLALKNSKDKKTPVRVIRKIQRGGKSNEVFVYDGLYTVQDYTHEKGKEGYKVFMFRLERIPGQPQLHSMLNTR